MPPTSARVSQEAQEPLIGVQYPMLCSRMDNIWQIGTASVREDHCAATGLRFVHWRHESQSDEAQHDPQNNPTVQVYQHLEDE